MPYGQGSKRREKSAGMVLPSFPPFPYPSFSLLPCPSLLSFLPLPLEVGPVKPNVFIRLSAALL